MIEGSAHTVLNVGGDEAGLRAKSDMLTGAGYRVLEARTGLEALHIGATHQPELVLLNMKLPDMSGRQICTRLKESHATAHIMVLCISGGDTGRGTETPGRLGGADGYLNEPVEPAELVASVHALLRLRRCEEENRRLLEQLSKETGDRKQAEQQWRESEQQYRLIAEMAQQGMWLIDAQGHTLFANKRMAEMLGCSGGELGTKTFYDFCFPEDRLQAEERIASNCRGRSEQFDFRFRREDGMSVLVLGETCSLQNGGNQPAGALGVFSDITSRKKAEDRLRDSRERLQYALDSADMVAWDWTPDSDALIQSSNASRVLGLPAGTTLRVGKEYVAMIHQEDQPRVVAAIQRALREGNHYHEEFRLVLPDASVRWVADRGRVTEGEAGKGARMTGVIRDITELKMREMAVRESEERFRAIFHQAAVGMCLISPEGHLLQVNQKLCGLLGEEPESLMHRKLLDLTHPEDRARNRKSMSRLLLGGGPDVSIEQRLIQRDGRSLWVSIYLALLWDAGGRLEHVIGVIQDIDERKRAEEALQYQLDLNKIITDNTPSLLFMVDKEGRGTFVNPAMEQITGYHRDELIGQILHEKVHHARPDGTPYPIEDCPIERALDSRKSLIGQEEVFVRKDGTFFPVRCSVRPILKDGALIGTVVDVQDITRQKEAEEQLHVLNADLERRVAGRTRDLVHSQNRLRRLASDLSLAEERERRRVAGELHDYLAQLLVATRMKLSQACQTRSAAKQAEVLGEVDQMLDQSLTYTRSLVAQLSPPVLHEFGLAAALKWLGQQMPRHGLTVGAAIDARPLDLSENQAVLLFQSVRELLLNVVKHAGTDRARLQLESRDGELRLTVMDQGRGFDTRSLRETAASHNAFGLFSIRERMESLGGRLEISARPGQGTTVTLIMPLSSEKESSEFTVLGAELKKNAGGSSQHSVLQQQAKFRVLLVDDHAMVRQGLRSLLENHRDVEVIAEAGDGVQAITLAETLCPDVVVMDLSLPLLDGVEATRRICLSHPTTVVIGLSVHQSRQMEEAVKTAGAAAFLTKDSAVDQLYEAMSHAMMARSV